MGDGQQLWASVEWIMIMRNLFIREEDEKLILCSGIPEHWNKEGKLFFGPSPTSFGEVSVTVINRVSETIVELEGAWRGVSPEVEIRMPGYSVIKLKEGEKSATLKRGDA